MTQIPAVRSVQCPKCGASVLGASAGHTLECQFCGTPLEFIARANGSLVVIAQSIDSSTSFLAKTEALKRATGQLVDLESQVASEQQTVEHLVAWRSSRDDLLLERDRTREELETATRDLTRQTRHWTIGCIVLVAAFAGLIAVFNSAKDSSGAGCFGALLAMSAIVMPIARWISVVAAKGRVKGLQARTESLDQQASIFSVEGETSEFDRVLLHTQHLLSLHCAERDALRVQVQRLEEELNALLGRV